MLRRGELIAHISFPTTVVCTDSLFWGWCVFLQVVHHMSVPIEKDGHASCSTPVDWLSFRAGVFQNVGASSLYHRAGVTCSAHFRALNHFFSGNALSNSLRNSSIVVNPSYVGSSLTFVITQRNNLIMMFQFSIVTSCSRFFHHSISSSESEV